MTTPTEKGAASVSGRPSWASSSAKSAAAIAKCVNRSVWTRKRSSIAADGSKSRTWPATRSGRSSQPSRSTRSRTLMPSLVDFQKVSVLAPLGAITPIPVTAARRGWGSLIVSSPSAGS